MSGCNIEFLNCQYSLCIYAKIGLVVRRSRRVEGHSLGPRTSSPAVGIQRFFAEAAGTQGGKMAPPDRSAAARTSEDTCTTSMPPSPPGSLGLRSTQSAPASIPHEELQQQAGRQRMAAVSAGQCAPPPSLSPHGHLGVAASPHIHTAGVLAAPAGHGGSDLMEIGTPGVSVLASACLPVGQELQPSSALIFSQSASTSLPHRMGNDFLDLKQQLAAIPTKHDMEGYIARLEAVYKSEIQALTANLSQVSDQVQRLEDDVGVVTTHQATQDRAIAQNTQHIHMLFAIAEDHENRNRRNNLRIRGIPETVANANILPSLQKLFNDLLGDPETSPIEIDRAHRTLGPKSQDPNRSRDILCRIHYFTVKELILRKARERGDIFLDGCKIQLLSDLSKMTLDKRRALRPLLDILRDHEIAYSWGYPFQLQTRRDGALLSVRVPADVPDFCAALRIPVVSIRDWPFTPLPPQRPQQRRRGRSPPSPQGGPRGARPARP